MDRHERGASFIELTPTGNEDEHWTSRYLIFAGNESLFAREKWVVTLQLGVADLQVDYYLGVQGSLRYLVHVALGPSGSPHHMLITVIHCIVAIGVATVVGMFWNRHREHQD